MSTITDRDTSAFHSGFHLSIDLPIYRSDYLSIYLSVCPTIHQSINQSINQRSCLLSLSFCRSACLSVCACLCSCLNISVCKYLYFCKFHDVYSVVCSGSSGLFKFGYLCIHEGLFVCLGTFSRIQKTATFHCDCSQPLYIYMYLECNRRKILTIACCCKHP